MILEVLKKPTSMAMNEVAVVLAGDSKISGAMVRDVMSAHHHAVAL